MAEWTEEIKAKVIKDYQAANPTAENTQDIVKQIADELGDSYTPNGVMSILAKAKVYVKKTPATGSKTNGEAKSSNRVSKADSIEALKKTISALEIELDDEIIGKLTGKAAIYFTNVIKQASEN